MIDVCAESGVPNLARIIQRIDKICRVVGRFNFTDTKCVCHSLDDTWVIVLMINNFPKLLAFQ